MGRFTSSVIMVFVTTLFPVSHEFLENAMLNHDTAPNACLQSHLPERNIFL